MKAIIYMLLLVSFPASAGEWALIVGAWSQHYGEPQASDLSGLAPGSPIPDSAPEWNERNQMLGIEYGDGVWRFTAAMYRDSFSRNARFVGVGLMYPLFQRAGWEIDGGGYLLLFDHDERTERWSLGEWDYSREHPSKTYVAPIPGFSVKRGIFGANLGIIPPIGDGVPWTGVIQFKLVF